MEREVAQALSERRGAFRAKDSSGSGQGVGIGEPSGLLEFDRATLNYRLNAEGRALLQPIFDRWGFDVSATSVHFTTLPGASGMALGDLVLLDKESWVLSDPDRRVLTLAHEMTHSVQYRQMGSSAFFGRYALEWSTHSQEELYSVPDVLLNAMNQGRNLVNIADGNYLLDQLAETIGVEASRRYRAQ